MTLSAEALKQQNHVGQFIVICEENGCVISEQVIDDPFVYTRLRPKGFRAAWQALRGKMELAVRIRGAHNAVYRAVMTADYTPDAPFDRADFEIAGVSCSDTGPRTK